VFVTKGGNVRAHKCIVSRCKFLKEKMNTDGQSEIDLSSQFDKETLEKVLEYLYTQKVEEKQDWDLLSASNILELDSLESMCVDALKEVITNVNVVKMLREVKNVHMRDYCYKFIERSEMKSALFAELTKEELLQYIVVTDSTKKKQVKPKQEITLENHLAQLFESKEYTDLTIISKDGQKFSVHKAILYPYFDVHEKELRLDFEGSALGVIIEFIYNGTVKLVEDPSLLLKLKNTIEIINQKADLKKLLEQVESKLNNVIKSMKPKDVLKFCLTNGVKSDLKQSFLRLAISQAKTEDLLEAFLIVKDVEEKLSADK
jgi:hypothetical protein